MPHAALLLPPLEARHVFQVPAGLDGGIRIVGDDLLADSQRFT
jgi:hypothetical protein